MRVVFADDAWEDYLVWSRSSRDVLGRIDELVQDIGRSAHRGLGKPQPLKGDLAGWWVRRIIAEHRLVYRVAGEGQDRRIEIVQCRVHY